MNSSLPQQGNIGQVRKTPVESAARDYPSVPIFGLPFSQMNMQETVRYLTDAVERRKITHVITGNPIMVMMAVEHAEYYRHMASAELIVPDGAGVVWAARYVGRPVAERVAGFDLLHQLLQVGELKRWKVYLLGTTQEIIETTASKLKLQYPLIEIVGYRDGFFSEQQDAAVVEAIRRAKPDLLFVARAVDNQEPWLARYKFELDVPVVMGIGGSFDVIAGKMKRAPVFFQRLGLEWLYRLLKQPSRYRRMLALPKFAVKVIREKENVTKHRPTS